MDAFVFECGTVFLSLILLGTLALHSQLQYKKLDRQCEYYKDGSLYRFIASISYIIICGCITIGVSDKLITPTTMAFFLMVSTVCTLTMIVDIKRNYLLYTEDKEQARLTKIALSIKKLETKYGLVIEGLYELVVKHNMHCLPVCSAETSIKLTSEQKKQEVIDDEVIREKIKEMINTNIILPLKKLDEYKSAMTQIERLKTLTAY